MLTARFALMLVLGVLAVESAKAGDSQPAEDHALGRAIFLHNFARPEGWTRTEPLGDGGDGLGPVFNEVSCVACHSQGGAGGGGGNEHNVQIVSLVIPNGLRPAQQRGFVQRAKSLLPQLTPDNLSVMVHQFGFGQGDDTLEYDSWRIGLLETARESEKRLALWQPGDPFDDLPLSVSERSTPAVWGMGVIERLRRADGERIRRQIIRAQDGNGHGVSGRVPRDPGGRPAWFGWRGHVQHLPEFVMGACANELGLTVSHHQQPDSPREEPPRRRTSLYSRDLTNSQVVALTNFVGSLPRPQQVFPLDQQELDDVYAGERVFESAGCAECHVPDFGFAKAIFSDFLLHDMGTSLSDPVAAFPENPRPRVTGNYYTGSTGTPPLEGTLSEPIRTTQEWRTPPLWGVADSAPYLHDGRAETLDDAIRLHAGEARHSLELYTDLTEHERSQLLTFLGTLRAPQDEDVLSSEMTVSLD